ncbi:MAG: hypothetical protein KF774_01685 [Planctomyces sp.]|nr:hypothetical protein [Planctomyces sp.]
MRSLVSWCCAGATALAVSGIGAVPVRAADVGTITGQVVLDGAMPKLDPKVVKGDMTAKDAAVCAAEGVPNEDLVVDAETKGIANVVVFLRKAPDGMPADLKKSSEEGVTFDQKGCIFLPHVLAVRTDQVVNCISNDGVAHNVHTYPLKNDGKNFVVPPNTKTPTAVPMKQVETLPVKVGCDIHPWMTAYWVVTDHPYVAITDEKGNFTIENLPVGEHVFTVWQEKAGYIERSFKVNVKAGDNKLPPLKAPVAKFKL